MVNTNEAGKEFIQGMFTKDQSFGEPCLIIEEPYPASAVANEDSIVIKTSKEKFLNILKEFPEILLRFTQVFAKRIYNKSIIAKEIAIYNPEHRIFTILNLFKKNISENNRKKLKVEISRQQIADMTGLRVETVIRTIKTLQKKDKIKIEKGKIYM
ncbi:MAG: Crp/Fnr family transcriptional regulator, partial [Ginsengibacter sp.]